MYLESRARSKRVRPVRHSLGDGGRPRSTKRAPGPHKPPRLASRRRRGHTVPMNLEEMRRSYAQRSLDRDDLDSNPFVQFDRWMREAVETQLLEPNAMALATTGADGQPTLRTVLLKGFDERGFVFYTNYASTKARQIAGNAHVALLFAWLPLERQVAVTGRAEKISTGESLKYFLSRPRDSQIGAWASRQSEVITTRSLLEGKFAEMKAKFSRGEVPLPDFWGGYRVTPLTFEFWQGRPSRLHDRFQYAQQPDGAWRIERLMP
jgi:pyridoxamine 5'-phosphate oxidase